MAFGYVRVSTTQQDEAVQRDALEAAGADRIYVDHASGATDSRPSLDDTQ
jgi:DNA invertase Pin-like site-specific DNA recombinase